MSRDSRLDLRSLLARAEAAPPVAAVDAVGATLLEALDAREVAFLIADFSGRSLRRLGYQRSGGPGSYGRETTEPVPLAGTLHGRALANQQVEIVREDGGARLLAPVTSRGEAVGVLELQLAHEPDQEVVADVALAAHLLSYIVIANRRYTDLFTWGQRTTSLSLAAEIQHRLLPDSYTCEGGQFTLAAWLEPAGEVAGDTFDFALERDTLHLSLTDAMGHTEPAAMIATILLGSLRNSRRRSAGLAEQARFADEVMAEQAAPEEFATGQLVRVDLPTGAARIVNAGHPPPLRVRSGRVEEVALEADLPFGLHFPTGYREQILPLAAGDRIVFLTDGILDRNAARIDVRSMLADARGLHARETVLALTQAVIEGVDDELRDDAAVLCLDWHGGPPRDRLAAWGADEPRH